MSSSFLILWNLLNINEQGYCMLVAAATRFEKMNLHMTMVNICCQFHLFCSSLRLYFLSDSTSIEDFSTKLKLFDKKTLPFNIYPIHFKIVIADNYLLD
jgi:hypothetical protein